MTDTRLLLSKIAALRQQLEQVQGLAHDADSTAASLLEPTPKEEAHVGKLAQKVAAGSQQNRLLDITLKQLAPPGDTDFPILPRQFTAYARRLLEQGRSLVEQLRKLANEFDTSLDGVDPLAERYHQTAAMADSTLRMIQAFPDAPSAQLR